MLDSDDEYEHHTSSGDYDIQSVNSGSNEETEAPHQQRDI